MGFSPVFGVTWVWKMLILQGSLLVTRGTGHHSVLNGSSTHKQRIERLWRDVHRVVIRQFKIYLAIYIFSLYSVFIPRINKSIG